MSIRHDVTYMNFVGFYVSHDPKRNLQTFSVALFFARTRPRFKSNYVAQPATRNEIKAARRKERHGPGTQGRGRRVVL